MSTTRVVFLKEVIDNFRDRRTLMTTLLMGPLFGPILFAFVINLSLKQSLSDASEALDLPVMGQEHAPNLVGYLQSTNINIVDGPASRDAALEAISDGTHSVVILITETFGDDLAAAVPATIEVITDRSNTQGRKDTRRARGALDTYSQQLAAMRLTLRGIDQSVMRPLNIDEVDVSTPSGRSAMLLGMLSYFFIFALLMGGMNLAIDSTAGERERGSLEPL